MRKNGRLSKREVQRLIKPVVSDLLKKVNNETSVLDQRVKMTADLSRQIRGTGDKLQSQIDPQKLEQWTAEVLNCLEYIVCEKTRGIINSLDKEIASYSIAEQLQFALSVKLLLVGGRTAAKKLAIALAASAGVIAVAIAISAALRDGETGEEARRRISEEDSP
jgi:hypothetical protein